MARPIRSLPLACSLLLAIGSIAAAHDRDPTAASSGESDHDRAVEMRAAHMADGKDRATSAKADVWTGSGAQAVARARDSGQAWSSTGDGTAWPHGASSRAAHMPDQKSWDEAAKADRAPRSERDLARSAERAGWGNGEGQVRAGHMRDGRTSVLPKADVRESGERDRDVVTAHTAPRRGEDAIDRTYTTSASPEPATTGSSGSQSGSEPAASEPRVMPRLWNRSEPTRPDQLPAAVKATIDRESGGRPIDSLSAKSENGRTIYDARILSDGAEDLRLKVAEDGSIVWRNDIKDQATAPLQQPAASVHQDGAGVSSRVEPDPVREPAHGSLSGSSDRAPSTPPDQARQDPATARANAQVDQTKLSTIDDTPTSAPVAAPASDAASDGWFGMGGKKVAIDQLPEPAQKTILREADGRAITAIERDTEHGKTVYKARIRVDQGKDLKLKVGEDGGVMARNK